MKQGLAIPALILLLMSCSQQARSENPAWINKLIGEFQSKPVGNPPESIWRYQYKGQVVYYNPPQCCDRYSVLYDANGNIICAPDGGNRGRGDGHCPDFFSERSGETLIWLDARKR